MRSDSCQDARESVVLALAICAHVDEASSARVGCCEGDQLGLNLVRGPGIVVDPGLLPVFF